MSGYDANFVFVYVYAVPVLSPDPYSAVSGPSGGLSLIIIRELLLWSSVLYITYQRVLKPIRLDRRGLRLSGDRLHAGVLLKEYTIDVDFCTYAYQPINVQISVPNQKLWIPVAHHPLKHCDLLRREPAVKPGPGRVLQHADSDRSSQPRTCPNGDPSEIHPCFALF